MICLYLNKEKTKKKLIAKIENKNPQEKMGKYQVKFKASAAKEYKKLPSQIKQRINFAIDKLSENPRISGVIKLQGDNKLDIVEMYINKK